MNADPRLSGYLKIYFGYAPGVRKTYQMLQKAHDLKTNGIDVVIGFLAHQNSFITSDAERLEIVPLRRYSFRGGTTEERDIAATLKRRPQVCVIDELTHSNVPGCEHSKRWSDVQWLRKAGINILTTMNVQDLASLSDQVWRALLHLASGYPSTTYIIFCAQPSDRRVKPNEAQRKRHS